MKPQKHAHMNVNLLISKQSSDRKVTFTAHINSFEVVDSLLEENYFQTEKEGDLNNDKSLIYGLKLSLLLVVVAKQPEFFFRNDVPWNVGDY